MSSKPIVDLEALGYRLAKDGYPTAAIETAVSRMKAMEAIIVDNMKAVIAAEQLEHYHAYMMDKLEDSLGPAADDVIEIIREEYDGVIPEGY
jgi:hypothetical protein